MQLTESVLSACRRGVFVLVPALLVTLLITNRLHLISAHSLRAEDAVVETADLVYVPDIRMMRAMSLGYDQAAADVLWIRTLEYFARHFLTDRQYRWLEYFLDQIIALDPQFRKVYHWAGANVLYGRRFTNANVALSNRFYEKALVAFPEDYEAAYRIGINYYVEMRSEDPDEAQRYRERGLDYLERAANTPGAPARMRSLVAAISDRLGKKQVALQYLVDLYIATEDPAQKETLRARLEKLQAEVGGTAYSDAAEAFQKGWQDTFRYAPAAMYVLMGEPERHGRRDADWRALLPDIDVDDDEAAAPPEAP